ncbi:MAG: WYL domain-containing protein [Clostridiales bacterium]|nr:WYL domain-containing protein [Clostridiales bacterium]
MPAETKNRVLYILKFLREHTDENHPTTIHEINDYLDELGIAAGRKTVADDIEQLQECGYDVVCNKSRQNQYFIGERDLELAELKMLVDAVQAAKFISAKKSKALIKKLSAMASPYQAGELNRQLYIDGRVKTTNESVYYIVDLIYAAINEKRQITFKYYEYTPEKKKVFKHHGQVYVFSPYDLVWSNDSYYVFGFSESHGKVVKFRVDRMYKPSMSDASAVKKPKDYDIAEFCKQVFMMYDGELCTVELLCENSLMKSIVDRFGDKVETQAADCGHFKATVNISTSPTFFAWIFTYAGKIKILSPNTVAASYQEQIDKALSDVK